MESTFYARLKNSCLLVSQDCRQTPAKVCLLHPCRRIHQVLRIQQGAIHLKLELPKKDNKEAAGDRLRDLLEWLEEFTENLEDTEVPASANISQDSELERPTKSGI